MGRTLVRGREKRSRATRADDSIAVFSSPHALKHGVMEGGKQQAFARRTYANDRRTDRLSHSHALLSSAPLWPGTAVHNGRARCTRHTQCAISRPPRHPLAHVHALERRVVVNLAVPSLLVNVGVQWQRGAARSIVEGSSAHNGTSTKAQASALTEGGTPRPLCTPPRRPSRAGPSSGRRHTAARRARQRAHRRRRWPRGGGTGSRGACGGRATRGRWTGSGGCGSGARGRVGAEGVSGDFGYAQSWRDGNGEAKEEGRTQPSVSRPLASWNATVSSSFVATHVSAVPSCFGTTKVDTPNSPPVCACTRQ